MDVPAILDNAANFCNEGNFDKAQELCITVQDLAEGPEATRVQNILTAVQKHEPLLEEAA